MSPMERNEESYYLMRQALYKIECLARDCEVVAQNGGVAQVLLIAGSATQIAKEVMAVTHPWMREDK